MAVVGPALMDAHPDDTPDECHDNASEKRDDEISRWPKQCLRSRVGGRLKIFTACRATRASLGSTVGACSASRRILCYHHARDEVRRVEDPVDSMENLDQRLGNMRRSDAIVAPHKRGRASCRRVCREPGRRLRRSQGVTSQGRSRRSRCVPSRASILRIH